MLRIGWGWWGLMIGVLPRAAGSIMSTLAASTMATWVEGSWRVGSLVMFVLRGGWLSENDDDDDDDFCALLLLVVVLEEVLAVEVTI